MLAVGFLGGYLLSKCQDDSHVYGMQFLHVPLYTIAGLHIGNYAKGIGAFCMFRLLHSFLLNPLFHKNRTVPLLNPVEVG